MDPIKDHNKAGARKARRGSFSFTVFLGLKRTSFAPKTLEL
jgi:hypothetical protein